jgi:hypothetical protein
LISSLHLFDDVTTGGPGLIQNCISQFRVSALRDSRDEKSQVLTPPSPGIQNSEMESYQLSVISSLCISEIRHFVTPVVKCFDTSNPGIQNSEMELDQQPGISSFHILAIQHFNTPVVKCFETSTPSI